MPSQIHFIEKADEMIARIVSGVKEQFGDKQDVTIVVTGDHTTPVKYGDHTFEPVPLAIARVKNVNLSESSNNAAAADAASLSSLSSPLIDSVESFTELSVARGSLGRFAGDQLMGVIKKYRMHQA